MLTENTISFFHMLLIGIILVFIVTCVLGKKYYEIPIWKSFVIVVMLILAGAVGSYLMFYVESGHFGGRSFFGGAFFLPIVMIPTAKLLRLQYGNVMDLCGPGGSLMLIISKIQCSIDGCCFGRMIHIAGRDVQFPSQKVEAATGCVLLIIMLVMIIRRNSRGSVFWYCLIIYGITRFFLNWLRETTPWLGPLPAGNVWSLVAIILGIVLLLKDKRHIMVKNDY